MKILSLILAVWLSALLPNHSFAEPYAEHNATRNLPQTLEEIEKRGNWQSFITGYMLNHDITSLEEAETSFRQIKPEDIYLCPEGREAMSAGVKNGTTGTYKPQKCRPGERIAYRKGKPVMSLYCGNLVLETIGFGPKPVVLASVNEEAPEEGSGQISETGETPLAYNESKQLFSQCGNYDTYLTPIQTPYVHYSHGASYLQALSMHKKGHYFGLSGFSQISNMYMGQKRTLLVGSASSNCPSIFMPLGEE